MYRGIRAGKDQFSRIIIISIGPLPRAPCTGVLGQVQIIISATDTNSKGSMHQKKSAKTLPQYAIP